MREKRELKMAERAKRRKAIEDDGEKQDDEEVDDDYYDDDEYGDEDKDDEGSDDEKIQDDKKDLAISEKYPEFKDAISVIKELKKQQPQFDLDGERNIWILKPAGSSRGRGICLKRDLVEIMDMCKQKETQYIC